ncbi:MAG: hypothetical protein JWP81_4564 [Ferruginibacter sp.]|nr:hypothetical protein [Ferruginibacter sp.]
MIKIKLEVRQAKAKKMDRCILNPAFEAFNMGIEINPYHLKLQFVYGKNRSKVYHGIECRNSLHQCNQTGYRFRLNMISKVHHGEPGITR